ncbi:hypothetical protein KA005_72360, partial [bacterium]|nr:hypothetical protein [bacterium]
NWYLDFTNHDTIPLKEWAFAGGADALSENTYQGITISGRNAGETTVQWDCLYWDATDSEWKIADNTGVDTSQSPDIFKSAMGMGVSAGSNGATIIVLTKGIVRNDSWAWTAGKKLYLSTGGDMTQTRPTSASAFIQEVGMAITDDEIYFDPKPIDWGVIRGGTTNDTITLNSIQATSTVWTVTVAAKDVILPAVAECPTLNTTIITVGAIAVDVDVNDNDRMMHDGVANADGHKATSAGAAGDQITCIYYDADGPICQSNSWTAE